MFFSERELARRTEEARPIIERLTASGCRFTQMEMPDNNGRLRGKIVPLAKGLSPAGTGVATLMLTIKSGENICLTTPFSNADNGFRKMVAVPDASTATALPWKGDVAAVLCDYYMEDGSPCPMDGRQILRSAEASLAKLNYSACVALEYELYIVEQNDALMREGRFSELPPFGRGRDFYSISKSPSFEGLAKEFMNRCEATGIHVEAFHTEYGHGMFEYTFSPQSPVKAADDAVRAKLYLKQLCSERGLAACYMAAKFAGTGDSFSGCHHNFSLARDTRNAFWDDSTRDLSQVARQAAAGILDTMPAFSLLYRPWVNSYRRMDHLLWNPENASWGKDNHTVALRVVHGAVPKQLTRFEHRVPGSDVNPYLTIASILYGALRGLRDGREPGAYAKGEAIMEKHWPLLPHTMLEAATLFRESPDTVNAFGADFVENLVHVKREEWADFAAAVDSPQAALGKGPVTQWEFTRYFDHC
jgi:glutamine synthetase